MSSLDSARPERPAGPGGPASASAQAGAPAATAGPELISAVLLLAIFTTAALMPAQNDTFWHLRTGQEILRLGAVPRQDSFSFTVPPGQPWPNHEWLAQVIMYLLQRLGGLPLLTLSLGVLATLSLLPSLLLCRGRAPHRAALLFIALPLYQIGWSLRPQIFTLALLGLSLWLLCRERLWPLPPLFLLWANLHGGVTLGGLLLVSATAAAAYERHRARREGPERAARAHRRLRLLLLVTGACGLATLLTPLGPRILLFPLESVQRLKAARIVEWRAPSPASLSGALFWLGALGYGAALATGWRRLRTFEDRLLVLCSLPFLLMAAASLRNVPPLLLLALPALTRLLPETALGLGRPAPPPGGAGPWTAPLPARLAVAAAAAGVAAYLAHAYRAPLPRLAWRPLSPAAIAAVRAAPEPMYNSYDSGGYLLWFTPERKVFIDSRQDPYPVELLLAAVHAQRSGDHEALFARYRIRSAVLESDDPVAPRLLRRGWRLRHRDERWLVLASP